MRAKTGAESADEVMGRIEAEADKGVPGGAGYRVAIGNSRPIEGAYDLGMIAGEIEYRIASLPVGGTLTVEVTRRW